MNRSKELFRQENLEKGINEIFDIKSPAAVKVSKLMEATVIECSESQHSITVEYPVLEWQQNYSGSMHGGLISTAFDEAFGNFAYYLANGKAVVTANISLNFQKPVPFGDSLVITARATSNGRKLITISGEGRLKSTGKITNSSIMTFAVIG